MKHCKHLGCRQAGIKSCECFGAKVVRPPLYVVWATPTHPGKPWAVGHEIRPGCEGLGDGLIHGSGREST
jgi:hypothetical protein